MSVIDLSKRLNLVQGDCLEVMKDIPDKSIDLILCDLPYGTTACKWDSIIPFDKLWEQYERIVKDNSAIVLTASQPFTSALVMSNIKMFKYCLVWDKVLHSNPLIAKKQPLTAHEDICIFYKKQPAYNPQMEMGDKTLFRKGNNNHLSESKGQTKHFISSNKSGLRYPKKIIILPNTNRNGFHPTEKPVGLMEYLVKTYSNEGDLVLDNCMGSGTTGVACVNTNRNFIGIELDKNYFDIAEQRCKEWENQKRLFEVKK